MAAGKILKTVSSELNHLSWGANGLNRLFLCLYVNLMQIILFKKCTEIKSINQK